MSTYAQFDADGDQRQIASNLGWSEFGDWCEGLNHEQYPRLVQLWEHGQSNDIPGVATDLEKALEAHSPSGDVRGSVDLLLDALNANKDAYTVYITN